MRKINLLLKKIALFAMSCSFSVLAFGQPTVITDRAGLENIKNNLAGSYILGNDIDLSDSDWTKISGKFTGTLDGDGYVIKGLTINASGNDFTGLFEHVGDGVGIKNLGVDGANVVGKNKSAILVGKLGNTTIENCWIINSTMKGGDHVGGFAGLTEYNAKIKNSYVSASVTATSGHAGGLAGDSDGSSAAGAATVTIENCYFTGTVTGNTSGYCGGILGIKEKSDRPTYISNCVNLASSISGRDKARRIIADFNGSNANLSNNYSLAATLLNGSTVSSSDAASLNGADITEAHSKSQDFYENTVNWDFGNVWEMGFAYPQLQVQKTPTIIYSVPNKELSPGQTYNLTDLIVSDVDLDFSTSSADAEIDATGTTLTVESDLSGGVVFITVTISAQGFTKDIVFVSKKDLITISTAAQLEWLKLFPAASFKLLNDIDMAGYTWEPGELKEGAVLDGDGYVIKNLKIDKESTSDLGFITKGTRCTIKNLGFENAYINGNDQVGAVIGYSDGATVHNCWVINSYIEGRHKVAPFIGAASWNSLVENCYAVAKVKARTGHAGGIVGVTRDGNNPTGDYDNPGDRPALRLAKNYFVGTAQGGEHVAGILGRIDGGGKLYARNNVSFAYSLASGQTANVHRIASWGAGENRNYSLENNYSISTTLVNDAVGTAGTVADWNGANIADDNADQTFFAGLDWDYTNDWETLNAACYPALKVQKSNTLPYLALENTIVVPTSGTVDLKEKFLSGNGAAINFTSSSNLVTITNGVIEITGNLPEAIVNITITLSATGYEPVTFPVTLAQSIVHISNAAEFLAINNMALAYQLDADIDLTGETFDGIGSSANPFTGTFDGNGKIIKNFTIDASRTGAGLFNYTSGATIKKLGVEGAYVKGSKRAGVIIGQMNGGTLEECYVFDSYSESSDHAGALAGTTFDDAVIRNCYASSKVYTSNNQSGGLVGVTNNTKISNCYFAGTVTAKNDRANGIVGLVDTNADNRMIVENSVVLAPSLTAGSGLEKLFRIINDSKGSTLTNNYALAGTKIGLSGALTTRTSTNANSQDGKDLSAADARSQSFYETTLGWNFTAGTGVWKMSAGGYPILQWQTGTINTSIVNLAAAYSFRNGIEFDLNELLASSHGLPLTFSTTGGEINFADGKGTSTTGSIPPTDVAVTIAVPSGYALTNNEFTAKLYPAVVNIAGFADFAIVDQYPELYYQLTADIDLTNETFNGFGSTSNPFTGTFDGNGHVIKGLDVEITADEIGAGLFRATNGATIKRLGVEKARVVMGSKNKKSTGIIIGEMTGGTLEECYSADSYVEGYDHAGGLVGSVYGGTLKNSYSTAKVHSRMHQAGGLVGAMKGGSTIENCYFSGLVTNAGGRAIGLGGYHDSGSGDVIIKNSVSLAPFILSVNNDVKQVFRIFDNNVDSNRDMALSNNYGLSTTQKGKVDLSALRATTERVGEADLDGADVTPARAKEQDFYATDLTWNFTDTWTMPAGAYPVLKWQADRSDKIASAIYILKDEYEITTENPTVNLAEYIFSSNGLTLAFESDNAKTAISNEGIMSVISTVTGIETAVVTPKVIETADFAELSAATVRVTLNQISTMIYPDPLASELSVLIENDVLCVSDLAENTTVNIYSIEGCLLSNMKASGSLQYTLPAKGFYIVEFVNIGLRETVKLLNK